LYSGDIGYFDPDGIFFVSGRIKRISKVYGLRIDLDDIERELSQYGTVAVTSTEDHICIFVENGSEEVCDQSIQQAAALCQLHPSAFQCRSVPALPRTSSGKIDYQKL
jgi:acyl-coenzyme A synthetase/AMP-(fatty) acid ligase